MKGSQNRETSSDADGVYAAVESVCLFVGYPPGGLPRADGAARVRDPTSPRRS